MDNNDSLKQPTRIKYIIGLIIAIMAAVLIAVYVIHAGILKKRTEAYSASGIVFRNHEKLVRTLRTGLRQHSKEITVSFHAKKEHMDGIELMVSELMEEALAETERADEGDYIRYQYGGYQVRYSNTEEKNGYVYKVRIIPEYYTYLAEEEWVSAEVERIIDEMDFSKRTSDYDKVTAIYDYVCENVTYDVVHKNKDVQHTKTTAYAALRYNTAVCQGYSVLLYRLFREAGIDSRIITGIASRDGSSELHAWNLVCVDGSYYNVDATWDTAFGSRDYYLKSDETFSKDHVRDEKFTTDEFCEEYDVSDVDFEG